MNKVFLLSLVSVVALACGAEVANAKNFPKGIGDSLKLCFKKGQNQCFSSMSQPSSSMQEIRRTISQNLS